VTTLALVLALLCAPTPLRSGDPAVRLEGLAIVRVEPTRLVLEDGVVLFYVTDRRTRESRWVVVEPPR
jgi:hypothetical protein